MVKEKCVILLLIYDLLLIFLFSKIYRNIINPGLFFIGSWTFVHLIYCFNLFNWGSIDTYIKYYFMYTIVFFAVTIFFMFIFDMKSEERKKICYSINQKEKLNNIVNILLLLVAIGIFISFKYANISLLNVLNNVEILFKTRGDMLGGKLRFPIYLQCLRYLLIVAAFFVGLFSYVLKHGKTKCLLVLILGLLYDITQFSKSGIFFTVMLLIIGLLNSYDMRNKKFNFKLLFKLLSSLIFFFMVVFIVQSVRMNASFDFFKGIKDTFESVYVYITCGIPGFEYAVGVDKYLEPMYGRAVFDFIFEKAKIVVNYSIPAPVTQANFFTSFREIYLDFHEFGFIIYPLLFSLMINISYYYAHYKHNILSYVFLCYFELSFLFSPISTMTNFTYFYYSIAISFLIMYYFIRKKIVVLEEKTHFEEFDQINLRR